MKYLILALFLGAFFSIVLGLILDLPYSEKLVGFGVTGLFLVVFPLFIYYRWKGKNFKDYMLTQENLEKMRENQKNKTY